MLNLIYAFVYKKFFRCSAYRQESEQMKLALFLPSIKSARSFVEHRKPIAFRMLIYTFIKLIRER